MYYRKSRQVKRYFVLIIILLSIVLVKVEAQPNCEVFKTQGKLVRYEACKKSEEINIHYQFSKAYQEILDEAIRIDPTFDFAYRRKSTAYLKSGDFLTWKKLIDKAVELNPKEHLGARAWSRFSWFHDYEGCIKDIEQLDALMSYDIGYNTSGTYHLNFVRAIAYKELKQYDKAHIIIDSTLIIKNYFKGNYDDYHLGVLKYLLEDYEGAIEILKQQMETDAFAENTYYLGLTYQKLNDIPKAKEYILLAFNKYTKGHFLKEDYNHNIDKIFKADIIKKAEELKLELPFWVDQFQ